MGQAVRRARRVQGDDRAVERPDRGARNDAGNDVTLVERLKHPHLHRAQTPAAAEHVSHGTGKVRNSHAHLRWPRRRERDRAAYVLGLRVPRVGDTDHPALCIHDLPASANRGSKPGGTFCMSSIFVMWSAGTVGGRAQPQAPWRSRAAVSPSPYQARTLLGGSGVVPSKGAQGAVPGDLSGVPGGGRAPGLAGSRSAVATGARGGRWRGRGYRLSAPRWAGRAGGAVWCTS